MILFLQNLFIDHACIRYMRYCMSIINIIADTTNTYTKTLYHAHISRITAHESYITPDHKRQHESKRTQMHTSTHTKKQ